MLKIRDNYIREKFNKKKEWKHVNEDQYILQNCDEEILFFTKKNGLSKERNANMETNHYLLLVNL